MLLLAVVKTFLYYSVPDRKPGRYNVGSTVLALVILAGIFGLTGGYQRMAALENWKQGVKDGVEEFRYGRDTLPKGNLSKAAGLQHGEEERLQTCLNTAPASLPKGEDYLTWFLTEEQEENAVAYAAAAVLAYRVAGDPARYVEGYHLAEQEKNDAVLTSQSAHAWAEVYVSGEGWLPVEVVPGMYTETYTNQMVEGKPAYQVGTSRQDDGLQAAEGTGNGSSKKEEPEEDKDLPGLLANIVLVILYGGFFLYLLLELQRAIRVQIHRRQKEMENGEIAEYYVNAFRELAAVAGVRTEEMTSSEQFFDAIRKHFPEVPERWYRRSMEILQRAKFGGKKLAPYEIYTLDCFEEKSHRMVYKKQNVGGKLWIRYGLCVEK